MVDVNEVEEKAVHGGKLTPYLAQHVEAAYSAPLVQILPSAK
jgi:hypothetical protein